MSKTLYLVTGARGHLGSALIRKLLADKCRVRGFALESERDMTGQPDIEMVYGDVRKRESLEPLFDNPDHAQLIVIHTAGIVAITSKFDQTVYDVNVHGTQNVVDLCLEHKIKKLIYVSSVHAIPEQPDGKVITEIDHFDPDKVHGLYAKTKAEATQIVLDAVDDGLDASVVHPSGILGPYDPGHNHLNQMILDYVDGRLTAGVQGGYDFVDVRDVVDCIIACIKRGKPGECYICSNQYVSVPQLMEYLHEVTGLKRIKTFLPIAFAKMTAPLAELWYKIKKQPPLYTSYSLYTLTSNSNFSHKKAEEELKVKNRPIKQTIADTYNWLRENGRFKNLDKRLARANKKKKAKTTG